MFSVIISEKGGAERREAFDRTEINVGRVQGNDLMLPKGNVSKRHARLLYRDGRFIVTDLKSTNGTYVNGRKIAQATIVREGDKIYIGDFVLRIEATSSSQQPPSPISDEASSQPFIEPVGEMTSAPSMQGATVAPSNPTSAPESPPSHPSSAEKALARATVPRIEPKGAEPSREVISHFPLEQDPDDSVPYAVPGPPKVPSATASQKGTFGKSVPAPPAPQIPPRPGDRPPAPSGIPPERTTSPSIGMASAILSSSPATPNFSGAATISPGPIPSAPLSPARRALPPAPERGERAPDPAVLVAHRAALTSLVEHVSAAVDLRPIAAGGSPDPALSARIERTLSERAAAMKSQGELRDDLDPEALVAEARRELLDLGPLTQLFDDEDVSEIHVTRHDYVVAVHGRRQVPSEVAFTSEQAVDRTIRRLCALAGQPLEPGERFIERRLPRGARMFVVLPNAGDAGHMMVIRKPQRADLTLEDLVRSGTISRAMAGLLAQCIAARANILVTGSVGSGTTSLIGALAAAGSTDDRVVVLQEDDELIFNQPHTISILLGETAAENARAVQAAARVRPDRLVVGAFAGAVAAEVVDAIGDGIDGVLAAARAPTLRQSVARLTSDLAATKPGVLPDAAREWLASSFDLAIEIARLRDGRHRVLRLAELGVEGGAVVVRDIFTFAIERTAAGGLLEGAFHPTGVVPGLVEDLVARGVQIDLSMFKRHPSVR
jgi:pilus assembly protein CpaF